MRYKLAEICRMFCLSGELVQYERLGSGHINETYVVTLRDQSDIRYLVQRINSYVFCSPEAVMHNAVLVTEHLAKKCRKDRSSLRFFCTPKGEWVWRDGAGEAWRVSSFIEHAKAFEKSRDPQVVAMAGKAFGQFQAALLDFDAAQLIQTIPDFHNTAHRIHTFLRHVENHPCPELRREIELVRKFALEACRLSALREAGKLPLRVTHNDTKTSNVMLNIDTLEPAAVIDLDTVMPGLIVHDFGDAVRSVANTAASDEPDVSRVSLDLDLYRAFTEGFIGMTATFLTPAELENMALGAMTMTVELAVRYLDDYLMGNPYFRIRYPEQNLVRARNQLALAVQMQRRYDEMQSIVREIAAAQESL